MQDKPVVTQASVRDLIDKEITDGRGIDQICDRFRNSVITRALEIKNGNQSRAAILLKTHRNNLVRWIHDYKLEEHYQ